jgi:hypothetical protein
MKRNLILLSILILSACSTIPTESASFFDLQSAPVILKADSTSEEIQRAMLESASKWKTLQISGTVTLYAPDGSTQVYQEQTWLDPLNNRYKVILNNLTNTTDKTLRFSDGKNNYNVNLTSGFVETTSYQSGAVEQMWGQIGTPLSEMMFPSNYAQNQGTFKTLGIETIAGREALIIEWTYIDNTSPSWKMWLDTTTAIILKVQNFGVKVGTDAMLDERVIERIVYNLMLDPSLFAMPADIPLVAVPTQVESIPVITESPLSQVEGRAGELYFFLQPRQGGGSIELARVSGICVFDSAKCPPLEKIKVPFALNFTIDELSWSPDGKYAAFAYPDNPNGTPQKLFIFDPAAMTWTPIAELPYIDPPFWSPDGNFIAFRTQDGLGSEEVHVIRPDGVDLKSVSSGLPAEGRPYIMDGWYAENIIMRPAIPGSVGNIYLVRASDGVVNPIFDSSLTKAQFIASPDASLFAYDDYDYASQKHILKVMEPNSANPVTLANFMGGSIYPVIWSPDSQLIAFNYYSNFTNGAPSAEVYVVSRDGGKISSVYKGTTVGRLVFSPNGKYLLVEEITSISGGHLFIVNLATLEQKILQAPGLSTDYDWYAPSWRP